MGRFLCKSDSSCESSPNRACRILSFGGHVLLAILVILATSVVIGWLVMTCWNYVIPSLFNLPPLNFWQAVAMLVLVRLLTGRLHHHCGSKKRGGKKKGCCWGKKRQAKESEPDAAVPQDAG